MIESESVTLERESNAPGGRYKWFLLVVLILCLAFWVVVARTLLAIV